MSASAIGAHTRGTVLAGRYRLDKRIATGGMGQVWEGTDLALGRAVAVKLLKAEYADDATFRRRLEAEARHTAALSHPGIAQVYDFGQASAPDGTVPYLVMELVAGRPLSDLVAAEQQVTPDQAADLVAQAADAVAAAHRVGIVHRDIKPGNLLVTPDGRVKVTDFGIARAGDAVPLTATGQIVGTPHYLAPEQLEGRPATPASDVYALGIVLYECLTGTKPYPAESPIAAAMAHLRAPTPALPDTIPAGLRSVCARAMAKDPGERLTSAAELATLLRRPPDPQTLPLLAPVPAEGATSTAVLEKTGTHARYRFLWRRVAATAALVLAAGLAMAALLVPDTLQPGQQPPAGRPGATLPETRAPEGPASPEAGTTPADNDGAEQDTGGGEPDDKGEGKPDDKGEGKPDDKGEGKPDDKGEGKPDDKGEGKPDDKGEGKPDDKGEGKPEESGNGGSQP